MAENIQWYIEDVRNYEASLKPWFTEIDKIYSIVNEREKDFLLIKMKMYEFNFRKMGKKNIDMADMKRAFLDEEFASVASSINEVDCSLKEEFLQRQAELQAAHKDLEDLRMKILYSQFAFPLEYHFHAKHFEALCSKQVIFIERAEREREKLIGLDKNFVPSDQPCCSKTVSDVKKPQKSHKAKNSTPRPKKPLPQIREKQWPFQRKHTSLVSPGLPEKDAIQVDSNQYPAWLSFGNFLWFLFQTTLLRIIRAIWNQTDN